MSKSGSAKKRTKKRKCAKGKAHDRTRSRRQVEAPDRSMTASGRQIKLYMARTDTKGSWKDHVLFVGAQMVDAWGIYQFQHAETREAAIIAETSVALLHKSKLRLVIGETNGALFWSRALRRRTNYGRPKQVARGTT